MEPINSNGSQTLKSYQPPKAEAAPKADAPKATVAVAPKFISPSGNIDAKSGSYTIQFRDTSSGEVKSEYPRKVATHEYSKPVKQEQGQQNVQVSVTTSIHSESSNAATNAEPLDVKA